MIRAACHCGAATLTAPAPPAEVTECNCSICRRLAARWAYYNPADVTLPAPATTQVYVWGERMVAFHRCKACGVTTHTQSLDGSRNRMAINARLVDDLDWSKIRIRPFDGADTWRFLDED